MINHAKIIFLNLSWLKEFAVCLPKTFMRFIRQRQICKRSSGLHDFSLHAVKCFTPLLVNFVSYLPRYYGVPYQIQLSYYFYLLSYYLYFYCEFLCDFIVLRITIKRIEITWKIVLPTRYYSKRYNLDITEGMSPQIR